MRRFIFLLLISLICLGNVDTLYLEADIWDMYCNNGTEQIGANYVQFGAGASWQFDGYWAFPITAKIYDATINSVKLSIYVSSAGAGDTDVECYGLQQEDCPSLEANDVSGWNRTTAHCDPMADWGTGQRTTDDIKVCFNEWVSDYAHSGTDRFGLVFDDNGVAQGAGNNDQAYDFQGGSYDDHTYLIIDYTPVSVGQVIIIQTE